MIPESDMRVEIPQDCMKGRESFSFIAGAWFVFSPVQEKEKMAITVIHTVTVMWVKRDSFL